MTEPLIYGWDWSNLTKTDLTCVILINADQILTRIETILTWI